jgi:DNA replication protein DnaC
MAGMIFESYEPTCPAAKEAVAICQAWAAAPKGFLILTGTWGTGKTHHAISVIRQAGGRYMTLADMVAEIQAGYAPKAPATDTEIVKALGSEPLLALDEVGRQRPSDDARYQIQRVMDERYILERPTVLVSNLPPQNFAEVLGPQIADRLAECCVIVRYEWESWRRK